MLRSAVGKAMWIGRAALFLPGVIRRRVSRGHPESAQTATRGMPMGGDLRRSTRMMPDLRRLIVLSVLCVLAALVVAAPASADSFANPTLIKIPASGDSGPATPYPSSVNVSGMSGPITDVNVTLHRFGHSNPKEIAVLLVSPSGDTVSVMAGNCGSDDIEDFTWIFDQQAANPMPKEPQEASCPDFVYRPNAYSSTAYHPPAPAPPGPHGTSLNDFNNENPNGTWSLYVYDAASSDTGDIEGGWTLTLTTGPYDVEIPGSGTSGPASPYPATRTVSAPSGLVIADLNVTIDGIFHQRPDDLDMLLVGPQGQKVMLMSDACGSFDVNAYGWVWDDEAAAAMPDGDTTNRCGTRSHRPADYEPGDVLPAPAPPGPYSTSLSSFDGTDPNGEWSLFVQDDSVGETGFFTSRFQLQTTLIDATAPDTVIDSGPTKRTAKQTAAFTFSSTEPASSFECKLDGGAFAPCSSPKTFSGLASKSHTFSVRATDAAGNVDATPATRSWTVDAIKPRVKRVVPAENATGIAPGTNVSAFFSEAMRAASVNRTTVKLFKAGTTTAVGATVSYDPMTKKATLNPNNNLRRGTKYKAVVTIKVKDLAGNRLDQKPGVAGNQPKVWFFTTRK